MQYNYIITMYRFKRFILLMNTRGKKADFRKKKNVSIGREGGVDLFFYI